MDAPKLRFKGFTKGWDKKKLDHLLVESKEKSLGDDKGVVLTSSRKGLFPRSTYFDGREDENTVGYSLVPKYSFTYRQMSDDNTFFINLNRDFELGLVSPEYPVFTTNELLDTTYFANFINDSRAFKQYCQLQKKGGTRTRLYFKVLKELEIMLPDKEEQKKIGIFLETLNKKIQLQQEKIDLLKEQKKGFMQKIFSRELRFRDEDGQEFPKWENKLIGEISDVIMGQSPDGSSYSEDSSDTVLVQGNADLKNGKIAPRIYTSQVTKVCSIGDIILTVRAPVGVVAKCNIPACIGRGVCAIRSDDFLFYYLDYYYITSKWTKLSQGSTFESVNSNDIKNIIVPQPTTQEKEKIISLFDKLTHKINLAEDLLSELEKQKQAFMQQMFI